MFYYQFNIGDYAKHTRHLNNNEDLAYRRLLDMYYLNEEPIKDDIKSIARLLNMRGCEEDIQNVLDDFFELKDEMWTNSRVERELSSYAEKGDRARENGKKGGRPRKGVVKQKEDPKQKEKKEVISLDFSKWNSKPSDEVFKGWVAHRNKKKVTTSQIVISKMAKEINQALLFGFTADDCLSECIERGWQGLKADWMNNSGVSKTALHDVANKEYYEGDL